MNDEPAATMPLHNRAGDVVAHALVDADNFAFLRRWRWHLTPYPNGYVLRTEWHDGRRFTVRLHHVVLGLGPGERGDHINRNRLDNRRANLRRATLAENNQNVGSRGGTSRYRGVCWDKSVGKWRAYVNKGSKLHTIGWFVDETEAAMAASSLRRVLMPFAVEDAVCVAD